MSSLSGTSNIAGLPVPRGWGIAKETGTWINCTPEVRPVLRKPSSFAGRQKNTERLEIQRCIPKDQRELVGRREDVDGQD